MMRNCCLVLLLFTTTSIADDRVDIPLRRVVMFTSGLSYFEHETEVDGAVQLELKFDRKDVNDLLKSLVVQDLGGGRIDVVSYPSLVPVSDQLRDLSIDLTSHPTLGELLHQLRGEQVQLDEGTMIGTIVGVELKPQGVGQQVLKREVLNLSTETGLRSVMLDTVGAIELTNAELNVELREALQLLVADRRADKKTVCFDFVGKGQRTVRIGYIRETPIWKTSYRLVFDGDNSTLLQGWAIVENTSDSDWNGVALTLTSGRPVTFQMDLYRPLFLRRQNVPPSVPPSLASRIYSPALGQLDMDQSLGTTPSDQPQHPAGQPRIPIVGPGASFGSGLGMGMGSGMGGMGGMGGGFGGGLGGGGLLEGHAVDDGTFTPSSGVVSRATSSEIGEQFQYKIAAPVRLARQRSAMIPIVDQDIEAEKLSIYTAGADNLHPMLAFRLTNTTDLRLTGGPITVFDDGAYAGDARIEYIRPQEKRLISYAQDLDLNLRYRLEDETRTLQRASTELGIVKLVHKRQREHRYRIQSNSDDDRQLVLEQQRDQGQWRLGDDANPIESTDARYRFEVDVPAKQTVEFVVAEECTEDQQFDLKTIDAQVLEGLTRRDDLPENVLSIIKRVHGLRVGIADLEAKLDLQRQLLADITNEQSRIRSNMSHLGRESDLYRRYLAKLTAQEDNFDKGRKVVWQTRVELAEMRRELAKFFPSSDRDDGIDALDPFGIGPPQDHVRPFGSTSSELGADPFGALNN